MEYRYDGLGNLTYKTGVGTYHYLDNTAPHKLSHISQGNQTPYTFSYDTNGNLIHDGKRTFTYTSFDKASTIQNPHHSSVMHYGIDRQLLEKTDCISENTQAITTHTLYLGGYEKATKNGNTIHSYHIAGAVISQHSTSEQHTHYQHQDNQGSVIATSDHDGNIINRHIYDPFGKQHQLHDNATPLHSGTPLSELGYTGHKQLNHLNIIHMKGRIYDPTLGRFLQADPFIQASLNSQSYNRYSYVLNNPMKYIDPTGYFFRGLKKLGRKLNHWRKKSHRYDYAYQEYKATSNVTLRVHFGIHRTLSKNVALIRNADQYIATHRWAQTGALAIATYYGGPEGAATVSSHIAYTQGASIDDIRMAGQNAFVSAYMFQSINNYYGDTWTMGRVGWTATAGGASSKMFGGQFRDGFMYAGAAAFMRYGYNKLVNYDVTWESGGDAVRKFDDTMPIKGANNIGTQGEPLNPDGWFNEGGYVSRGANYLPGVNAVAGLHDVFQVELGGIGGWARNVFNVPGMIPAAVITYGALLTDISMVTSLSNYRRMRNGATWYE